MPLLYKMYEHRDTIIHRINPVSKLIWIIYVIVAYAFVNNAEYAFVYLIWCTVPFLIARLHHGWRVWAPLTLEVWIMIAGLFLWATFFPYGKVVLNLEPVIFTDLSVSLAFAYGFRALGGIWAFVTYLSTTRQKDLIRSLRYFRLPSFLAMALTLAFRFTPVYLGMSQQVREAQKARAFVVNKGPITRRVKAIGEMVRALIVPAMHSLMRMVNELTLCLDSKGWVITEEEEKTKAVPGITFKTRDKIFLVVNSIIFVFWIISRFVTGWSWIPMEPEAHV